MDEVDGLILSMALLLLLHSRLPPPLLWLLLEVYFLSSLSKSGFAPYGRLLNKKIRLIASSEWERPEIMLFFSEIVNFRLRSLKTHLECLKRMWRGVGVGLDPPPGDSGGRGGVNDDTLSLRVELHPPICIFGSRICRSSDSTMSTHSLPETSHTCLKSILHA